MKPYSQFVQSDEGTCAHCHMCTGGFISAKQTGHSSSFLVETIMMVTTMATMMMNMMMVMEIAGHSRSFLVNIMMMTEFMMIDNTFKPKLKFPKSVLLNYLCWSNTYVHVTMTIPEIGRAELGKLTCRCRRFHILNKLLRLTQSLCSLPGMIIIIIKILNKLVRLVINIY